MMIARLAPMAVPAPGADLDPKRPIKLDVEYFKPIFVNAHLGGTPSDVFDQNPGLTEGPYVKCTPEKCGPLPQEVYHDNPLLNADGTPKMRRYVKHLEDAPESPLNTFVLWGLMGGAAAGTLGLLGGAMAGMPVLGGLLGAAIGTAAGGVGAWRASGDRIKIQWNVYGIVNTDYVGYREEVTPATENGVKGFKHHFVPDLKARQVGVYKVPSIVHYKEKK